ncbi:MAG: hypothetical protein LIP04_11920 [Tannerellaceae bacterium]|nr:hypothetical protein [Tannerellaceae bacterium]
MNEWNKKSRYFLLMAVLPFSGSLSAQSLYWENGLSFSKWGMSTKRSYTTQAGLRYLIKDCFFLSTGVGLLHRGDEFYFYTGENLPGAAGPTSDKYLLLNTLFHVKKTFRSADLYAGVGPMANIYLKSKNFPEEKEIMKSVTWGLDCTADFQYRFEPLMAGLSVHYYPAFTSPVKETAPKDKTYSIGASIGYMF